MISTTGIRTALLITAAAATASCSTPVSPSEHPEAGGVVILDATTGVVIAQVIGDGDFATPLQLTAGETLEVQVKFLDADDPQNLALAFLPDEDEDESLRVVITSPTVVTWEASGDFGTFAALTAGQTSIRFQLYHANHVEWQSGALTVTVQ